MSRFWESRWEFYELCRLHELADGLTSLSSPWLILTWVVMVTEAMLRICPPTPPKKAEQFQAEFDKCLCIWCKYLSSVFLMKQWLTPFMNTMWTRFNSIFNKKKSPKILVSSIKVGLNKVSKFKAFELNVRRLRSRITKQSCTFWVKRCHWQQLFSDCNLQLPFRCVFFVIWLRSQQVILPFNFSQYVLGFQGLKAIPPPHAVIPHDRC